MRRMQAAEKRTAILKMFLEGTSRQKIADELKIDYGTVGRTIAQFRKNPEIGTVVNEGNKVNSYESHSVCSKIQKTSNLRKTEERH